MTVDVVAHPLALVAGLVRPGVDAMPALLAPGEFPCELGLVGPTLDADAILQVVQEVAGVRRAVAVQIHTKTVRHVLPPLPGVDVAVAVSEPPLSPGLVLLPLTLVDSTVRPRLDPKTAALIAEPLTVVHCVRAEGVTPSGLHQSTSCVGHGTQFLVFACEVAGPIRLRRPLVRSNLARGSQIAPNPSCSADFRFELALAVAVALRLVLSCQRIIEVVRARTAVDLVVICLSSRWGRAIKV
mmetsp:Transcript_110445/g.276493  ORF Transcript_110445/g.276493 Transcript_110445/m.276493 type:complete len:241 (+) Transcript_110445:399-1121(+)